MNPLAQMNRAMEVLEAQLTGEIDFDAVARTAGCSQGHFRRMFSYLAGMPLSEYVRCRRLSLAGELLRGGARVIDCAALLGYESPDSFARAFAAMHGVTPSQAGRPEVSLKAFPPMAFQLTIRGGNKMDVRIVSKEAFRIVGFKQHITLQFEGVNRQLDPLIARPQPEQIALLKALCNQQPAGMLSVSANFSDRTQEGTELDQFLGVATTLPAPQGYEVLEVEACDWAVFTVVGPFPAAMQDTWARIYAEWFPASGRESTGGPEMVWHESPDLTREDCKCEIWIPLAQQS